MRIFTTASLEEDRGGELTAKGRGKNHEWTRINTNGAKEQGIVCPRNMRNNAKMEQGSNDYMTRLLYDRIIEKMLPVPLIILSKNCSPLMDTD